ncbi:HNH endonuclease [Neorhizobium sp. T7_12]|jgi:5-methylcytosine-specific restriction protein A|uniref:HNH endonuclease n=1 Tax=Neorhizobium sp. T7_12 TaxID=2093832 RepID=UPI000CF9407E
MNDGKDAAAIDALSIKRFLCESCNYAISQKDQKIWGTGFELHHLMPWGEMQEGVGRELITDDFAVLCAACHRAIHRSAHVLDVRAFRSRVLVKRGV